MGQKADWAKGNAWWLLPAAGVLADVGGWLFGKHEADTAHQREVRDMKKAGLNPMWMNAGSGAPVVSMSGLGSTLESGVSAGLNVGQQESRIAVMNQQVQTAIAKARQATSAAMATEALTPLKLALLEGQIKVTDLNAQSKEMLLPFLVQDVQSEILSKLSGARQASAMAFLQELASKGAIADADFAEAVGVWGPIGKVLLNVTRALSPFAVANVVRESITTRIVP